MFDFILMLLLLKEDFVFKKKGCKRYAFLALDFYRLKMIFTLLTKVVIFYV